MPKIKWIGKPPPKINHLATLLRGYKLAAGMSSEELGTALGCTGDNVRHQLGKPADAWRIGELKRWCDALGVPYDEALAAAAKK